MKHSFESHDKKLNYLVRTLSRTNRKDFENYVINAIYNRVGNLNLRPVSQQFIKRNDEGHQRAFIDLYFPQINMGVECDEGHHAKQVEEDSKRTKTIFDVLNAVTPDEAYKEVRIDVEAKSLDEVEEAIDSCVNEIQEAIREKERQDGKSLEWDVQSPESYFADCDEITVDDPVWFETIAETSNNLLGTEYKGMQRCGFLPKTMKRVWGDKYIPWFPKLAVEERAVSAGWNNQIIDKTRLVSFNEETANPLTSKHNDSDRVVFALVKDPITRESSYRFMGVFRLNKQESTSEMLVFDQKETCFSIKELRNYS